MGEKTNLRPIQAPLQEVAHAKPRAGRGLKYLWFIPELLIVGAAFLVWRLRLGLPDPAWHETVLVILILVAACGLTAWRFSKLFRALVSQSSDAKAAQEGLSAAAIENSRLHQLLTQTEETLHQQLITTGRTAELERQRANEMAATLGSMTDGVILCNAIGQIQQINHAAEEILGHESSLMRGDCAFWAEVVGLCSAETGEPVTPVQNPLALALETGRSCPRREYRIQTASGEERFIELASTPVTDETGKLSGAVAVFHDITALKSIAAREAAARSRIDLLLGISQKLNASMDIAQINEIVVRGAFELAMGRCDLKQTALFRYDRAGGKITRVARFPKPKGRAVQSGRRTGRLVRPGVSVLPEDLPLPIKPGPTYFALYVKRNPVVTWLPEEHEVDKAETGHFDSGAFDASDDEEHFQVAVRLPLSAQGEILGHLTLYADSLPEAGQKDGDGGEQAALLSALSSLASLAAISIYNAQLYDRVQQRAQQMTTLWSVGKAISAHLDVGEIADALSDQVRQVLGAEMCVLSLYEGGRLAPQGRAAEKAPGYSDAAGLAECECDLITRESARKNTPISQANIESMAPGRCRWRRSGRLPGPHSVLAVPLIFDNETLGVLTVYRSGPSPFTQEESDLITTLGSLSVAALRNARSFENEHNIAETLQTFFLTSPPANVPGFDIAEQHYPTSQEARIGGDYFDFIPLSSSRLAILIGDISGKGLAAAAYTAMAKYTLRAFTSTPNIQPSQVVDFTNLAMTRHTSGEIFSTLFYGFLDFTANTLTYVNAGHEPPLLLRKGEAQLLEATGMMVGAFPETSYEQEVMHLQQGDILALYTDGLTDVRSPIGAFFTHYGARDVLKRLMPTATAAEMATALYTAAREFSAGVIEDDIALLVVKAL